MGKMRTKIPKKPRQRPHLKSIAGVKLKQRVSVNAVSSDLGVLKKEELSRLKQSKSLGYDKYLGPFKPSQKESGMWISASPACSPSSAFADINFEVLQNTGVLASRRTRHKLASSTDLAVNSLDPLVVSALVVIQNILDKNAFRVIDLFRRGEFNSSIRDKKLGDRDMVRDNTIAIEADNNLDATEFQQILRSYSGDEFNVSEIKALIKYLDKDGNGQIDAMELKDALRVVKNLDAHERKELKDELQEKRRIHREAEQRRRQTKIPKLSPIKLGGTSQQAIQHMTTSGRRDHFTASLLELDRFLHLRRMRALDLFREAEFNSNAGESLILLRFSSYDILRVHHAYVSCI